MHSGRERERERERYRELDSITLSARLKEMRQKSSINAILSTLIKKKIWIWKYYKNSRIKSYFIKNDQA